MKVSNTPIAGLLIIEPTIWRDDRGYFFESYNRQAYKKIGVDVEFLQDNQSSSKKGALRGLHCQKAPFEQGKLVRVIKGKVWDVAVDIRKESETYGQHFGLELSEENQLQFWIPPGFLHGFLTLENDTIFSYKCTNVYNKESEMGVIWNDENLTIDWHFDHPIVSEKDKNLPSFSEFVSPF